MNKVITDGLILTPPAFGDGLDVWSSENGTPGSATYQGASNASLIASDSDFGTCLELLKTQNTQKLRYMGETPMSPGCYLRVNIQVKAISGPLPTVRVAAWAGAAGGAHVASIDETGDGVALSTYGKIETVSAIIGSGARTGVDMVWGTTPIYGHFGLDMTGANGGVIRIQNIEIEDITSAFHNDMLDVVDVVDFGAIGNGSTDCRAAFEAADAAANGRTVFVPKGTYFLGDTVTINSKIRFHGTVTMPNSAILSLTQNFDLPNYIEAFGSEQTAFKKAIQALFNFSDHDSLDLAGRRIEVTEPFDIHAIVGNRDSFSTRRVIRNGQFNAQNSSGWNTDTVNSSASYSPSNALSLTNVNNIANIQVGSLVTGQGVGEETYVKAVNTSNNTITLSNALWGAQSNQTYTFERFKYILDFSGFTDIKRFTIENIEFLCNARASAVMMPPEGLIMQIQDCYFTGPKDRGVTSIGKGCQGLQLDRNQFLSSEQPLNVQQRKSIAFNVNCNDTKIRNNRAVRFKHFGVMGGSGHLILGNHFFQGDSVAGGQRTAGLILKTTNCKTVISNNYIDNCFVEWGNSSDPFPSNSGEFSFGSLTITSNIFMSISSASWFRWIQIKPYGPNHVINGLNISGNTFKHINGANLQRVESVNTTHATLDFSKTRNVTVEGNTFNGISNLMKNPVTINKVQSSAAKTWTVDLEEYMPFGSRARTAVSIIPHNAMKNSSNVTIYTLPYAQVNQGPNKNQINLVWSQSCKGNVNLTARCDNPQ